MRTAWRGSTRRHLRPRRGFGVGPQRWVRGAERSPRARAGSSHRRRSPAGGVLSTVLRETPGAVAVPGHEQKRRLCLSASPNESGAGCECPHIQLDRADRGRPTPASGTEHLRIDSGPRSHLVQGTLHRRHAGSDVETSNPCGSNCFTCRVVALPASACAGASTGSWSGPFRVAAASVAMVTACQCISPNTRSRGWIQPGHGQRRVGSVGGTCAGTAGGGPSASH